MNVGTRFLGGALLVAALASAPARADFLGPYPWSYTLRVGPMFPAGQEGAGLDTGFLVGGNLGYEVNPAFILGADLSLVRSPDDLRTNILALGMRGRLSPTPDFNQLYILGGLGAHGIFYNPRPAQISPPSRIRLGGSFGLGFDAVMLEKVALGVEGEYHGIVFAKGDALSYITISVHASLRPGAP